MPSYWIKPLTETTFRELADWKKVICDLASSNCLHPVLIKYSWTKSQAYFDLTAARDSCFEEVLGPSGDHWQWGRALAAAEECEQEDGPEQSEAD